MALRYNCGRRVEGRDIGIDFSDIHPRFVEGVEVNKLDDGEVVYLDKMLEPSLIFIKSRKVFRVYKNDPNWYLHVDDTPIKCSNKKPKEYEIRRSKNTAKCSRDVTFTVCDIQRMGTT